MRSSVSYANSHTISKTTLDELSTWQSGMGGGLKIEGLSVHFPPPVMY